MEHAVFCGESKQWNTRCLVGSQNNGPGKVYFYQNSGIGGVLCGSQNNGTDNGEGSQNSGTGGVLCVSQNNGRSGVR